MNCKRNMALIILLVITILTLVIYHPMCLLENKINSCFDKNIIDYSTVNLINSRIILECFTFELILCLYMINIYLTIKKTKIENRGIKFKSQDGTFGTADWMNNQELTDSFDVGTENGLIVGKIDDKIVTLPDNTTKNKNVAIFGASGSKKSRRICYS